ncbi:hypothetical protein IAU59_003972 [Kwoniella sp. CBS 9459]
MSNTPDNRKDLFSDRDISLCRSVHPSFGYTSLRPAVDRRGEETQVGRLHKVYGVALCECETCLTEPHFSDRWSGITEIATLVVEGRNVGSYRTKPDQVTVLAPRSQSSGARIVREAMGLSSDGAQNTNGGPGFRDFAAATFQADADTGNQLSLNPSARTRAQLVTESALGIPQTLHMSQLDNLHTDTRLFQGL